MRTIVILSCVLVTAGITGLWGIPAFYERELAKPIPGRVTFPLGHQQRRHVAAQLARERELADHQAVLFGGTGEFLGHSGGGSVAHEVEAINIGGVNFKVGLHPCDNSCVSGGSIVVQHANEEFVFGIKHLGATRGTGNLIFWDSIPTEVTERVKRVLEISDMTPESTPEDLYNALRGYYAAESGLRQGELKIVLFHFFNACQRLRVGEDQPGL